MQTRRKSRTGRRLPGERDQQQVEKLGSQELCLDEGGSSGLGTIGDTHESNQTNQYM